MLQERPNPSYGEEECLEEEGPMAWGGGTNGLGRRDASHCHVFFPRLPTPPLTTKQDHGSTTGSEEAPPTFCPPSKATPLSDKATPPSHPPSQQTAGSNSQGLLLTPPLTGPHPNSSPYWSPSHLLPLTGPHPISTPYWSPSHILSILVPIPSPPLTGPHPISSPYWSPSHPPSLRR